MIVYPDSFLILCLPEIQFFSSLNHMVGENDFHMVFVISGNYNVLYVNECKLESLYIFTITAKLLYKLGTSKVPTELVCFGNDLTAGNIFILLCRSNKNCYLQCVTVNKAGNPYVLDPDVSVSMTLKATL